MFLVMGITGQVGGANGKASSLTHGKKVRALVPRPREGGQLVGPRRRTG